MNYRPRQAVLHTVEDCLNERCSIFLPAWQGYILGNSWNEELFGVEQKKLKESCVFTF